jgi:hypothetical protein
MNNHKIIIHPKDIKPRDFFHFGLKLKSRMHVHLSNKTYQRQREKKLMHRECIQSNKGE